MIVLLGIGLVVLFLIGSIFRGVFKGVYFLICLLSGGAGAHTATKYNWGVDEMEYEDGVSIRQESNTGRPSLFFLYAGRGHLGGGISGGK